MGVDCGQVLYKVVGYNRKQVNQIAAAPSRKQRISKHDVKHCLAASVKSGEIVGDTDTVSPEFEPILNDTVIFGCRIRVLPWDGLVFELREKASFKEEILPNICRGIPLVQLKDQRLRIDILERVRAHAMSDGTATKLEHIVHAINLRVDALEAHVVSSALPWLQKEADKQKLQGAPCIVPDDPSIFTGSAGDMSATLDCLEEDEHFEEKLLGVFNFFTDNPAMYNVFSHQGTSASAASSGRGYWVCPQTVILSSAESSFTIKRCPQLKSSMPVKVDSSTALGLVFKAFCQQQATHTETSCFRFTLDGVRLNNCQTVGAVDLEDGDCIDVWVEQTGGQYDGNDG